MFANRLAAAGTPWVFRISKEVDREAHHPILVPNQLQGVVVGELEISRYGASWPRVDDRLRPGPTGVKNGLHRTLTYKLHLPTEEELATKLRRERDEIKHSREPDPETRNAGE